MNLIAHSLYEKLIADSLSNMNPMDAQNNTEMDNSQENSAQLTQKPPKKCREDIVRICRKTSGSRTITIAFQILEKPDEHGNNIRFAATIFNKKTSTDHFNKKSHVHTATERLKSRPLWMYFNVDEKKYFWPDLHKAMYRYVRQHAAFGLTEKQRKRLLEEQQRLEEAQKRMEEGLSNLSFGECKSPVGCIQIEMVSL